MRGAEKGVLMKKAKAEPKAKTGKKAVMALAPVESSTSAAAPPAKSPVECMMAAQLYASHGFQ
jgi:hypothetical protein